MKTITPETLYDLILLDDIQVSPDSTQAAFVRTTVDRSGNKYNRTIWIQRLDTPRTPAQPLTGNTKDGTPRWSPDGSRLGFISGRDEKPAVFVLPMGGGEARNVASHPNGINAFEWSPDGKRIAFTAGMRADECEAEDKRAKSQDASPRSRSSFRETERGSREAKTDEKPTAKDAWDLKREKEQKQHDEEMRIDPRIVSRVPYRTGTTFIEDRYTHLYVADVPASFAEPNENKPRRMTPNDSAGNFIGVQWSADGKAIYSVTSRDPDSGELFLLTDIVRFDANKKARAYKRLPVKGNTCYDPLPSPDGKWIAFDKSLENKDQYEPGTLCVMPANSARVEDIIDLTDVLDRSTGAFKWSPDGKYLYFTLLKDGAVNLWRCKAPASPRTQEIELDQLTDADHEITSFDVTNDGRVVFIACTPQDPSALFMLDARGRTVALYQPNVKLLGEMMLGEVEEIRYESDGRFIQGWLIRPPGFSPRKKYPMIVQMHGGPHVMWGAALRSMWHEFQAMAGAGYAVFYCNPRGSDGYGRDFHHSNRGDWGDGPMRDVLAGVDLLVERDYIDGKRLCLTGGSYAGYLTAWIVGRDHRFVAACAQRGVYNLVSMRNTSDIPFFNDRETGSITPWDDVEALWRMSPISLVPNVQTPLLIEHSELDYRVPIEQGEQLFQALRLMKKKVKMIRWPREGHELSRAGEPKHRLQRIESIIEWFNEHIK
jgi:dipeptidyl aminopeptidase/acylaminoacyl peptidase